MVDSPTNVFTTATDVGGVVSGNYCTWNPNYKLVTGFGVPNTLTNGNLTSADAGSASYNGGMVATMGVFSGKWYWEATNSASSYTPCNGIAFYGHLSPEYAGLCYEPYGTRITLHQTGTPTNLQTGLVNSTANGDIIGIALDADNKTIAFYKNNVQVGTTQSYSAYLPVDCTHVFPGHWTVNKGGGGASINLGQRPFSYTPPAGFKSLTTTNIQALGTSGIGSAAITANKWFDINIAIAPLILPNFKNLMQNKIPYLVYDTHYTIGIADQIAFALASLV
jgi:hypothetical protein